MTSSTFRVLVLGDFHYGESYGGGGRRIIRDHGYDFSTEYLGPFLELADKSVVNLETPLAKKRDHIGQFSEARDYIHWADPVGSTRALVNLGVDAVGLANNHSLDLGAKSLEATFEVLSRASISWFGAGMNREAAERPYSIELPRSFGGGNLEFYGFFELRRRYRDEFCFYAKSDQPGCASLSRRYVPSPMSESESGNSVRIAFPHWGPNYVWRSEKQEELALKLFSEGYDMVLGHGAHSMQEIQCLDDRWVAYSIGNSNFQSPGRWPQFQAKNGIFPFGFWTMLEVHRDNTGHRRVASKFYPVYLDNKVTNFQPKPVNQGDFSALKDALRARQPVDLSQIVSGQDDLGYFLKVDHGEWTHGGGLVHTAGG